MRNTDYFKNKRITILGFGRSGLACANLLYDLGSDVCISDIQDSELTRLNLLKLKSKQIKVELGRHSEGFIKNRDLIIISPGISDTSQAVIRAKGLKIPIISEIEAAWILCPGTIIAVTGSCGKTTITTLIGKILAAAGRRAFVCGNIGNPFSGEVDKINTDDFVSLEVSSFQLENCYTFKPKVSLILNFSPNHLDRYKNLQEYLEAKKRIFINQDNTDYLVLNSEDRALRELAEETKAKVVFFSQKQGLNPNQAAVLAVGGILGIGEDLVGKIFNEFKGIEHRLEYVTQINGIKFINDSKATTVDSCVWALKSIGEPIILIAGGKDKGVDYDAVLEAARKKVKQVILIGQAKQKIERVFKGHLPVKEARTMQEAVSLAYKNAESGDCVLLSPMCASFDMFSDYEERGRVFKKAVLELCCVTLG
ncbi:MAG: Mur ligase family protein [Candidatus Omnitrophota bacterium]